MFTCAARATVQTSLRQALRNIAQTYERSGLWQKRRGERLLELAHVRPGEVVLDLGCGTGALARQLAELVGPCGRVVGIDPDEARIEIARSTHGAPNLTYRVGAAETLGAGSWDRPFDLIFSNFVFHWIRDKRAALVAMRDLLRPGGRVLVQWVTSLPQILVDASRLSDPAGERVLQGFAFEGAAALARYLEDAGLTVIRLEQEQGTHVYPTLDTLLTWWQATTHNRFDPRDIAPEALARFAERYSQRGAFEVRESFCWLQAQRATSASGAQC